MEHDRTVMDGRRGRDQASGRQDLHLSIAIWAMKDDLQSASQATPVHVLTNLAAPWSVATCITQPSRIAHQ